MLTLSAGANFNTGGRHNSEVFGCRPDAATQINFRFNFGFHRNWNVYADLGYTFYSIHSDPLSDKYADLLVKLIMPGISTIHPSFSIGASHLSQVGRWQFMPRIGAGCQAVKTNKQSKRVEWHKDYRQTGNSPLLHRRRIRVGFRTSRVCSVIFDICYHHPLESASLTVSTSGAIRIQPRNSNPNPGPTTSPCHSASSFRPTSAAQKEPDQPLLLNNVNRCDVIAENSVTLQSLLASPCDGKLRSN